MVRFKMMKLRSGVYYQEVIQGSLHRGDCAGGRVSPTSFCSKSRGSGSLPSAQFEKSSSDKSLVKQSAQPIQGGNLASEVDARTDDADPYVGDQEFSVGKSPCQDNLSVNEQTSGVGGLGQGSPKLYSMLLASGRRACLVLDEGYLVSK